MFKKRLFIILLSVLFLLSAKLTHAATTEDYLDGLSGTPNVSVQKSGTAKKIVVSGTLTQIGQDDIGGRWTRTVYYRQRSSKENPSDADTSSHQNSCKVGDEISSSTAQNHFVCTIDGLADDTYYFRIGSNGKATTWTAYMHTPMAVVVSDSTLDTTGGDKTGDTSALAGVNGETYQIPNQPIVGTLGSVSGAPTANTITVTLKVANPTDGAYYRLFLGKSADMKGTSCTQFEDGSEHQAESADLSKKLLQFDETWTQNITDGIYCIGLSRTADGSKKTVVASFPAGIVTIGATNIPANTDAPPPINQYGCQSTDNNSYCMISPLPGLGDDTGKVDTKQGIEKYIKGIIQLVIGIIGVLAVLMIVVGGIEYMSTVSIGEKEGAKSRITNALIGLLLALSSYTILNTINPDLVNLKIHLPEASLVYRLDAGTTFGSVSADQSTTSPTSESLAGLPGICDTSSAASVGGLCTGNTTLCTRYAAIIDQQINDASLRKFLKVNMVEETGCDSSKDPFDKKDTYGIFQQSIQYFKEYAKSCNVTQDLTADYLKNPANVDKEICMQALFIKDLQTKYSCGSDWRNIAAGQAGGPGACLDSTDCAGDTSCITSNTKVKHWECLWQNASHTTYNTGFKYARYAAKKMQYCLDHPSSWMN